MSNLMDALTEFDKMITPNNCEANELGSNLLLEEEFQKLAETLIYRGHLRINYRFDIYARSVEFYFNSEDSEHNKKYVHDPVMFHRGNVVGEELCKVPFFKLGHFFLHQFGLDITFEKNNTYRASALIKTFNVVDSKIGPQEKYKDFASSYLYDYVQFNEDSDDGPNGDIHIEWIDDEMPMDAKLSEKSPRIGIFEFRIDEDENQTHDKLNSKDIRPWRFYRAEPYNKLKKLLDARKL